MTREQGIPEKVLSNFTCPYILLFEKPLHVYGFFPFTYLQAINLCKLYANFMKNTFIISDRTHRVHSFKN